MEALEQIKNGEQKSRVWAWFRLTQVYESMPLEARLETYCEERAQLDAEGRPG